LSVGVDSSPSLAAPSYGAAKTPPLPVTTDPLVPTDWHWLVGFYLGVPLLLVIVRPEIMPHGAFQAFMHYVRTVVSAIGIGGGVHAAYVWVMPRVLPRIHSRVLRLVAHVTCILVCVAIGTMVVMPLLPLLCARGNRDHLSESFIATTVVSVVVTTSMSYYRLKRRAEEIERREQAARQAAVRAELAALQARTNPHFLFNSLNTVASLIAVDPPCAEATLERLAGLFRYALDGSRRESVRLSDEIEVTRTYLDIESLRFGERLRYRIDVPDDLGQLVLPPLTLQPLVENAVIHGIAPRREGGSVRVTARRAGDRVSLCVEDDGPGHSSHKGSGTALEDLRLRLEVFYGGRASLERRTTEAGHTVELSLPHEVSCAR
jgi:two-component system sensor histidine kinase AlgZ